ncbi:PepSY domain-containing protein [Listeria cossartiae subsp. cayugensis]|uniref:PepSY domain-containing protein n=1 Tax=Listeria cossartiae TaxID=2838249 RepID=UPI0028800B18|nr:PepSY domain-containing protein [Listeria cossartiae]MDT0000765.1 PepSY domain-containing protein [Listeria cossartiae subsp. cayugensis]MDT0009131.1 PepSY domain-containing protein [Listeria cossartiae subsp. cayugensis]MDT0030963.1 PepSY domain-containing protein [Listeria cossartiae subsp. cayugensis]MDT0039078.1 PepSY domain-containing protein [Listeria cossartiae subsp. cayugensis]MDT0044262.1 PepSY domain-containing protein [Listeria cossartiae subsp. cayugensis]
MYKKLATVGVAVLLVGALSACGSNDDKDTSSNSSSQETTTSKSDNNESLQNKSFDMSYEDAINAFKEKHGDAEISSVELEKNLGKYVYKVDGISNDNEYEMKFNAETKEQLSDETDKLDREDAGGVEKENEKLSLDGIKTPKEAMDKAVTEQAGDVTSWKIERELDTTYYEVTVKQDNKKYEIKLNAKTLDVLQTEQDD